MQYKKVKRAKKARMKPYSSYQANIYSVACPHCHTVLVGGVEKNVLMFVCSQCGNTIDLRDTDGKRAYEQGAFKTEIEYCKCSPEQEFMKRNVCISCGKLKSNDWIR